MKESFYKETRGLGEIKETISRENLLAGLADAISASADSAETQEPAQASSSSVNPPSEQPSTREKSEKIAKEKEGHEGMERLADFIKTNHGSQDWGNGVYNLQDYLAAFIGAREKEVYQDLIERMKGK